LDRTDRRGEPEATAQTADFGSHGRFHPPMPFFSRQRTGDQPLKCALGLWMKVVAAGLTAHPSIPAAAALPSTDLQIVTPRATMTLALRDLRARLVTHTIEFDDPIYQLRKSYDGFRLTDVFEMAGFAKEQGADEVIFTAMDGYSPNVSFEAIRNHVAYLVFQEHGRPEAFEPVQQGKTKVLPGPYYLVWQDGRKVGEALPWPYQLVKIEVANFAEKYSLLFPHGASADSPERRGSGVFKSECIRCHSINLQGGTIGPELNAPKNVTEYWQAEVLQAFIKDAPGFRYMSKMPAFPQLSDAQVANLVSYFRYTARHKISRPDGPGGSAGD
jgi:mono/diheme cytochrome c family protein